jgi:hypothetical protein
MSGFRETFDISYPQSDYIVNQTNTTQATGVSLDDVETSALLVQN